MVAACVTTTTAAPAARRLVVTAMTVLRLGYLGLTAHLCALGAYRLRAQATVHAVPAKLAMENATAMLDLRFEIAALYALAVPPIAATDMVHAIPCQRSVLVTPTTERDRARSCAPVLPQIPVLEMGPATIRVLGVGTVFAGRVTQARLVARFALVG
jgi:hypothetical protein